MAEVIADELQVCDDCAQIIANGEINDGTDAITAAHRLTAHKGVTIMSITDLDTMVASYIESALWSSHNELFRSSPCDKCGTRVIECTNTYGTEWRDWVNEMDADCREGGAHEVDEPEDHSENLDGDYDADDLEDDTRDEMHADCLAFFEANADDLADMDAGQTGHDFWLTRNRHGAGFWDRGLGDLGDRLTAASKPYGEYYLMAHEDGTVSGQ